MTILYTPLDIKFDMPSYDDIIDWFDNNKIYDPDFWVFKEGRHEWALCAASHEPENWQRIKPYNDWLAQDHKESEGAKLRFAPHFCERLPGLVEAIKQMPFKEIGAVGMLKQLKNIEPHVDTYDPTLPLEPRRYMIYLTDPSQNTFYIEDQMHCIMPEIHDTYRAFAFNSTDVKHGATPPNDVKILMSVVGILDHDRHNEMIERSVSKFGDYVITRQSS